MKHCQYQQNLSIRTDGTLAVSLNRNKCESCPSKKRKRCAQSNLQKAKNNYKLPDKKQELKIIKFTILKATSPTVQEKRQAQKLREEETRRAQEEQKCKELDKINTMKNKIANRRNVREFSKKILSEDNKSVIVLERVKEDVKLSNKPYPIKKWRRDLCDSQHYD